MQMEVVGDRKRDWFVVAVCVVAVVACAVALSCIVPRRSAANESAAHVDVETQARIDALRERFGSSLPDDARMVVDQTTGVCYVVGDGMMCPILDRDGSPHIDGDWARANSDAVA